MATKAAATQTNEEPAPVEEDVPESQKHVPEGHLVDHSVVMPDTYEDTKSGVNRVATPGNADFEVPPLDPDEEEVARLEALGKEQEAAAKEAEKK